MQDGVLQASLMLFNVPVEPERALNPPQLCKRTALLQDGSIRQDPRRSRTVRGVTALTRDMDTHTEPINTHLRRLPRVRRATKQAEEEPHRPIQMHLVGPPSTHQWPARLYARAPLQLRAQPTSRLGHSRLTAMKHASLLTLKGVWLSSTKASQVQVRPTYILAAPHGHYSLPGRLHMYPALRSCDLTESPGRQAELTVTAREQQST